MLRQVVDRIAAIAQLAGMAVDEGRRRVFEVDADQPAVDLDISFLCHRFLPGRTTLDGVKAAAGTQAAVRRVYKTGLPS